MAEPLTVKERMEALGWAFDADYDPDGERLMASAIKLREIRPGLWDVIAYHTDAAYRDDHAACRSAWMAEWSTDTSAADTPAHHLTVSE